MAKFIYKVKRGKLHPHKPTLTKMNYNDYYEASAYFVVEDEFDMNICIEETAESED